MVGRTIDRVAERLRRAHQFVTHDIWAFGEPGERVPNSFLAKQARVAVLLVQKFIEDQLMVRASALAFVTALAILPVLIFLFVVIQSFNLGEGIYGFLDDKIETTLGMVSAQLVADDSSQEMDASAGEDAPAAVPDEVSNPHESTDSMTMPESSPAEQDATPAGDADEVTVAAGEESGGVSVLDIDPTEDIKERLQSLIFQWVAQGECGGVGANVVSTLFDMAEKQARDPGIGNSIFGIIILIATVFGLMRNVEKSFASIWATKDTRSYFRTLSNYLTVVLVLPIVLVGVLGLTAILANAQAIDRLGPFAILLQGFRFLLIWAVFASIYAFIPAAAVKLRYAIVGGVVAGTAWVLMSMGYVGFQVGVAKNNLIYATFYQIPLLLVWIYLSWAIVLFGAELTYAYQHEKTFALERWAKNASFAYKEAVALRAALELSWRFDRGLPPLEAQEAAEKWNVPVRVLGEVLEQLKEANIVSECAGDPPSYQPARSLNRIGLNEILRAIRNAGKEPSGLRGDPAMQPLLAAVSPGGNGGAESTLQDVMMEHARIVNRDDEPLLLEDDRDSTEEA